MISSMFQKYSLEYMSHYIMRFCGILNVIFHMSSLGAALLEGVALLEEMCHYGGGL